MANFGTSEERGQRQLLDEIPGSMLRSLKKVHWIERCQCLKRNKTHPFDEHPMGIQTRSCADR